MILNSVIAVKRDWAVRCLLCCFQCGAMGLSGRHIGILCHPCVGVSHGEEDPGHRGRLITLSL
jgi:hypothetical protein